MMVRKDSLDDRRIVSRRRLLQATGAGSAAFVAGCIGGGGGGGSSGGGQSATPSPGKEGEATAKAGSGEAIKIGSPLPLTGQFSPSGKDNQDAIRLAIDDFITGRENVEGSPSYVPKGKPEYIGSIKALFRDTQLDASVGTRKMNQLIDNNGVDAIVGGVSTSVTIGMAEIANKKKILTVLTGTGNTAVTGEKRGKYTFRTYPNAYTTSNTLTKYLAENKDFSNWYIVYSDYGWGQDQRDFTTDTVKSAGGEIAGTAPVPFGETDFSSPLTKVQNSGADMALLAVFDLDAVNALKQASQFGLQGKMGVSIPIWTVPELNGLSKNATKNVWGTLKYFYTFQNENNYNFVNRFHGRFGRVPSSEAETAYKSALETLKATERAQSTNSDDIIAELEGARFTYFKGEEEYYRKCDHQCIQPDNVGQGVESLPQDKNLPETDFPPVKNVRQYTEEDGIWRSCDQLPGNGR